MGFSVTAAHAIIVITLLAAAGVASTHYWTATERLDTARRSQAAMHEEIASTNLTLVEPPTYEPNEDRYTVRVLNSGASVLRVSGLHFLVDGLVTTAVESLEVEGDADTDLWLPGETLEVKLSPIATEPTHFRLVSGNGSSVYYKG